MSFKNQRNTTSRACQQLTGCHANGHAGQSAIGSRTMRFVLAVDANMGFTCHFAAIVTMRSTRFADSRVGPIDSCQSTSGKAD